MLFPQQKAGCERWDCVQGLALCPAVADGHRGCLLSVFFVFVHLFVSQEGYRIFLVKPVAV
jgi:hypothetical protein